MPYRECLSDRFSRPGQDGFSLVEVVIAMLMLALMSLGLIPLMITATRVSVDNRSQVAATAFANSQISEIQAAFANDAPRKCSELAGYEHTNFSDPGGTGLVATRRALTSCSSDPYSTVRVEVKVAESAAPTTVLATLTTEVLVSQG